MIFSKQEEDIIDKWTQWVRTLEKRAFNCKTNFQFREIQREIEIQLTMIKFFKKGLIFRWRQDQMQEKLEL